MAENYLITGYWGEPHVTVENERGFNAAVFGTGKFVLPVGEMFRAEYIGNNTVRIYDGKLIDNGAVAGIPAGEYIELMIPEAGQGMKRNDLIIFEYSRNDSTLVESGVFKVLSGAEASETAVDPVLTENDLLSNIASFDQMALWRVSVNGSSISAPEILYNTKFAGERIAKATSTDGKAYTVNLPGVAKLYTGLEIIIIPDIVSATTLPTLNVNGLGAVHLKRRITSNTLTTVQSENEEFLCKDQPIRVIYNGKVWVMDMARANVNDLYGKVPVENGGTGADNAEEALTNLGAISKSEFEVITPTITAIGLTISSHSVQCVRVGKIVLVAGSVSVSATSGGTDTLTISGIPQMKQYTLATTYVMACPSRRETVLSEVSRSTKSAKLIVSVGSTNIGVTELNAYHISFAYIVQ